MIHFVYSVPGINQDFYLRVISKINKYLSKIGLGFPLMFNNKRNKIDTDDWPSSSPFTITKNIYEELLKKEDTRLYHLHEQVKIKFSNKDIFIGHPYFPYTSNEKGVTENALSNKVRPEQIALLTPLHCNIKINTKHINKKYLDHIDSMFPNIDILFGIMGEYWWDEWDNSPYSHWKSKMVRIDMAIDTSKYKQVKIGFNKKNQRKFLFIGINDPTKGISFLSKIASNYDYGTFGWIGSGPEIENVFKESEYRILDSNFMRKIAKKYDFIISPSYGDANPTTILEGMSWGFPIICTPQSGYYETSYRFNIEYSNIKKTIDTLNHIQNLSDQDLINISNQARKDVESNYTWKKFTSSIMENLDI